MWNECTDIQFYTVQGNRINVAQRGCHSGLVSFSRAQQKLSSNLLVPLAITICRQISLMNCRYSADDGDVCYTSAVTHARQWPAGRGGARRGAAVTIDTSANTNLLCWIFMSWAPDLCVQTLRLRKPVRCNFYANQFLCFASEITLFSAEFISRLSWTSGNNTVEAYESLRSKSEVIREYDCVRGGIR